MRQIPVFMQIFALVLIFVSGAIAANPVHAQATDIAPQIGMERPPCYMTNKDVAQGEPIALGLLTAAQCTDIGDLPKLSFDRRQAHIIAVEAIAAGTNIGRLWIADAPVRFGDKLILVARSGPVAVHRPVVALQSARPGRRLFVRDNAGEVFSITFQPGDNK